MNKGPKMNKKLYIISIIVAIFVITTSIGYGLFSKSLSINGVATTLDYYSGTKLPHTPVDLNNQHSAYFLSDYNDEYTYMSATAKKKDGYFYALVDDSWNNDTYTITFDKAMIGAFQGKTITYNIAFSNPTVIDYTEGTVTVTHGNVLNGTNVSTASGTSSDVSSATATLSSATVAPNGQVTISLSITMGTMNFNADTIVKAQVAYRLYSGNSGIRYFNFIVKYDSSIVVNNLFDESTLTSLYYSNNNAITAVNNGFEVAKYPATIIGQTGTYAGDKIITDLKQNLIPGATYRFMRDYQGVANASAGMLTIRDASNAIVKTPTNRGLRFVDFSLTQEEIDSINRIYIYGAGPSYDSNLFTFIRIIKISD